jgi:hypothetical protein
VGKMIADRIDEDDGPVVLARRKSRHGDYYEEIPPQSEPEPVPVQPEHVPEPPGLQKLPIGEPGQVLAWKPDQPALDYITGLDKMNWTTTTAVWSEPQTSWSSTGMGPTGSYSISLNDVIGSYKGTVIGGDYDYNPPGLIEAASPECGHVYTDIVGPQKFKFNKSKPGGTSYEPVQCKDCGKHFTKTKKF